MDVLRIFQLTANWVFKRLLVNAFTYVLRMDLLTAFKLMVYKDILVTP